MNKEINREIKRVYSDIKEYKAANVRCYVVDLPALSLNMAVFLHVTHSRLLEIHPLCRESPI